MNEMEINIYDSWFDPVLSSLPGLIPDGFIYLRASPDTCHKRMKLRRRSEEGGVTLDYLRDLHEKHENWLFPCQTGNHGVLSVSQLPLHMDNSLHPDIRDRVFYLEGNHMHSSIQKVFFFQRFLYLYFSFIRILSSSSPLWLCHSFVCSYDRFLLWFWTASPTLISAKILKPNNSEFALTYS